MNKILIPAFNEEKNIDRTINEFKEYGEVVVCDNNPSDGLKNELENEVKLIREHKKGKGHAVRKLLKEKGDIFVLVDGDDAFYSKDCEKMISMVKNGEADMIIGKRINVNEHTKENKYIRKIGRYFLDKIFYLKYKQDLDFMSGLKVFNKKAKQSLDLNAKGFGIDTEITVQTIKNGFSVKQIPVNLKKRKHGKQKANLVNVGLPVLKQILFS